MFNNANVIFRTKFVDGVSTVSRTIGQGSSRALASSENTSTEKSSRKRSARGMRDAGKENAGH